MLKQQFPLSFKFKFMSRTNEFKLCFWCCLTLFFCFLLVARHSDSLHTEERSHLVRAARVEVVAPVHAAHADHTRAEQRDAHEAVARRARRAATQECAPRRREESAHVAQRSA